MRVVLFGGSSFSTPALFAALASKRVLGGEFILVGRTDKHAAAVTRAAKLVAGENAAAITGCVASPDDAGAALVGADVVVVQMRIGGMRGRSFDERFPLEFGLCGDEGLGPGGLSAAWRAWPILERWLAAIANHAPQAVVLMVSSPVGILTRAVYRRFPGLRCFGICEVPFVCLRQIGALLDVEPDTVAFDYLGVNHLGWLYGIHSGARDLLTEWANHGSRRGFPGSALIEEWQGIPTKYLRLHFEPGEVVAAQCAVGEPRAVALERLQHQALVLYETGSEAAIKHSLGLRDTPWYCDSIAPLLRGLSEGTANGPFFLSVPNDGYCSACAGDDVLEMPFRVRHHGFSRLPVTTAAPKAIATLVERFCRYERLATDAVLARSAAALESALKIHPWVADRANREPRLVASLARAVEESTADANCA